jgi:hypothetical protein
MKLQIKKLQLIGMVNILILGTLALSSCDDGTISDLLNGKTYNVTVGEYDEGTIVVAPASGAKGTIITVTVEPADDYKLKTNSLTYNNTPITWETPYRFVLPEEDVIVEAEFEHEDEDNVSVTGIELEKTALYLLSGTSETVQATVVPENATNKNVVWLSLDTAIATVTPLGEITVNAATETGVTVKIKATTVDGEFEAECTVTACKLVDAENHDIGAKFGVLSRDENYVAQTFEALHAFLPFLEADPERFGSVISVGTSAANCDYIDLPSLTIPAYLDIGITETTIVNGQTPSIANYYKLRMIVVGINSFNAGGTYTGNDNGTSTHIVFQFQNCLANSDLAVGYLESYDSYQSTLLRTYIIGDLKNAMKTAGIPFDNDEIIWAPKRVSYDHETQGLLPLEDQIWLPTEWEMTGATSASSSMESAINQAKLEYYIQGTGEQNQINRRKYLPVGQAATAYWLGSPCAPDDEYEFGAITSSGGSRPIEPYETAGISPAFVVK